jgi:hypothetical protein
MSVFASKCGGPTTRTRHRNQPLNGAVLVEQIWPDVCCRDPEKTGAAVAVVFELAVAPGRSFVKINGETHYPWRAVDYEGEVLESYVTKRRDRKAAVIFLRKSMKRHGQPHIFVTDKLRSYGAAMKVIGNVEK